MSNSIKTWIAAGVASAFALALMVWLGSPVFPLDDAYIVQHSVLGLLQGEETRFAEARPLSGATSPVHVFLMAAFTLLLPVGFAQLLVAAAAAVVYVAGCFHLALKAGASTLFAAGVAILAVFAGHSVRQMFNGLETGLAMAAVIWALIWFFEARPDRPWKYALLGLLPYIRPELAALSGLLLLRAGWAQWTVSRDQIGSWALIAGAWTLAGVLPIALVLLLNGYPLTPNTVSAKAYFFAEGCLPTGQKSYTVSSILFGFGGLVGLTLLGLPLLLVSRFRWIGLGFIGALIFAYWLRLPGGLWHNHFRYLHLILPLIVAGWALLPLLPVLQDRRVRRVSHVGLACAVGLGAIGFVGSMGLYAQGVGATRTELASVSEWVRDHLPADSVTLIHDAGYISRLGQQPLVDLVGLKTPSSIEAHKAGTWAKCRRDSGAIAKIARDSGARHMVVLKEWDGLFQLTAGLRAEGWTLTRVDGARGDRIYRVYALAPPPDTSFDPVGPIAAR